VPLIDVPATVPLPFPLTLHREGSVWALSVSVTRSPETVPLTLPRKLIDDVAGDVDTVAGPIAWVPIIAATAHEIRSARPPPDPLPTVPVHVPLRSAVFGVGAVPPHAAASATSIAAIAVRTLLRTMRLLMVVGSTSADIGANRIGSVSRALVPATGTCAFSVNAFPAADVVPLVVSSRLPAQDFRHVRQVACSRRLNHKVLDAARSALGAGRAGSMATLVIILNTGRADVTTAPRFIEVFP